MSSSRTYADSQRPYASRARLNRNHQEMVREKIRASMIINHLQNCLLGKLEMTDRQVRIAFGLLAKSMPDLQRTELVGANGGPVLYQDVPATPDEASRAYLEMLRAPKPSAVDRGADIKH